MPYKTMNAPEPKYYWWKRGRQMMLYDCKTKEIEYASLSDRRKHRFFIHDGYSTDDKDIKRFDKDFHEWIDSLAKSDVLSIFYTKYYNDYSALTLTFKRLCDKKICSTLFDNKIDIEEVYWIEQCNNGGHTYLDEQYIEEWVECYGYDYSGFYPWLMSLSNLKIPKCKGKEVYLTNDDLLNFDPNKPGFYRINLTYTNKMLCKVFQFSKYNVYTHTSVQFLLYIHHRFPKVFKKGDVTVTLIEDDEPNAYLYDDWYNGSEVFEEWYLVMKKLKAEQGSKNKLTKWLSSGLWGYLSKYKYDYVESTLDYEQKNFQHISDGIYVDDNGNTTFRVVNIEEPGSRFALLKPFLTSMGRMTIANAMYKLDETLNNVVRVYCDDIVLSKQVKIPNTKWFKLLKPEKKTTGVIYFKSRGRFYNETEDYYAGQWSEDAKHDLKIN